MDILLDYIYKLQDKFPQLKPYIQEYEANNSEESFIKLIDETLKFIEDEPYFYPLAKALRAYKMKNSSHKGGN